MQINTADILSIDDLSEDLSHWLYNGLDCCVTSEIFHTLYPQLNENTARTYDLSLSLQGPVLDMTMRGILVDDVRRREVVKQFKQELARLEDQLNRIVRDAFEWTSFNWRSPKQLNDLLYKTMNLPEQKKRNSAGVYAATTDREALEKLGIYLIAEPVINHLLGMRDLGKAIGFLETPFDADGRMRTRFNIAGTKTGRFASSESDFGLGGNLQNVSRDLRSIFVADKGMKFANLDLEQADSRNIAANCWNTFYDSRGPEFAGAYLDACEGGDLHTTVAKMALTHLPWGTAPDRQIADTVAYRDKTYRDLCKVLGHGCLTEDHEVLTPDGWVSITEKPPVILEWSEAGSSFAYVSNWVDKEYSGDLHRFYGNSQDLLMTADHRVPFYKDQKNPKLHVRPAAQGPATFMPLGSGFRGGSENVPARFIAAVMCDGHLEKGQVAFHFKKDRKFTRLIELCDQYGLSYKRHGDKIRVKGYYPKRPGAFMFQWTAQSLRDFIDELKYWDGHQARTSVAIFSKHREDLEWYQTFGRILGVGGNIRDVGLSGFGTKMYRLQQNNRQYANGECSTHEVMNNVTCRVLCPTVPSSFFYVRRNGKVCVTGNSNYLGTPPTMSSHSKIPLQQVKDFQKAYFDAFPAIPSFHQHVFKLLENSGTLVTLFGRQRQFWGRPNDASTRREAIAFMGQSPTADAINYGLLNLWRNSDVQLLVQVHDSILFQYPEELEDEVVPQALELLRTPIKLAGGREFCIPLDAKVGWNWGDSSPTNPDGLKKYKGGDTRKRTRV